MPWRAKEREDAVVCGTHDIAVVPAHGLDQELKSRIDQATSVRRIELLHQLGRAFDIGEQRCDESVFAVQYALSLH